MRLCSATTGLLPAAVERPRRARTPDPHRIVHLGIGAFHRAHQAVYTDDAMAAGDSAWGITGVSLRSRAVRDALAPQDGFYTVVEKGGGDARLRLIGAIDRVLVAPEDPAAVVAAIADPATSVVTLTVTEKGYHRQPGSGGLMRNSADLAAELRGEAPRTIYGYIAAALALRRAAGRNGLTLVSCDNLSGNGRLLHALLMEFLDTRDPGLRAWAETSVACPDTMVDRIVPATTPEEIDRVEAMLGVRDEATVITERFRQWVIEDRFAGPRPRWEAGGAQFVEDVAPYELAKLRLLNGSHSTLAYIGRALGYRHVHEAIADPDLGGLLRAQLQEAVSSLTPAAGLDPDAYIAAILARFTNAELPHRLDQIAMDGSQKIPQRWLATIIARAARGDTSPRHLLSVAAWIAFTRGRGFDGSTYSVDDPLRERFSAIWATAGADAQRVVQAFIAQTGVFPPAFQAQPAMIGALAEMLEAWLAAGPRATLRRHLER